MKQTQKSNDPARLSAAALARLLSAGGKLPVTAAAIRASAAPRNRDGTYHVLRVVAWLIPRVLSGQWT
jgi:hypothetical protein